MAYSFKTWTAETLTAADLNAQFAKIENKLGNIINGDIANTAGITSIKLADRYTTAYITVPLFGDIWGGNFTFEDNATQASVEMMRFYPEFPGKRAFLVSISARVDGYGAGSGNGTIWFSHNGTVINSLAFTADATQYIRAGSGATAFASPLAAFSAGDYIGIQCGSTATGTPSTADVIGITLTFKVELTS